MVILRELRRAAIEKLKISQNDSPRADVDFLLTKLLKLKKSEIILGEREITDEEAKIFSDALLRLSSGEPAQYVVGECEFMSLPFKVGGATLVPRADTEILVEKVIELCGKRNVKILEIGCGSGCISVSLAYYMPNAQVFALDVSEDALKIASENAKELGVSKRICFFQHDIMQGFPKVNEEFDVIVSNPPYIPSKEVSLLDIKVKDFEPKTALDGGADGLDFYRQITKIAQLKRGGYLAFEVGINQAGQVFEMVSERFSNVTITKDLSGIDRVVTGQYK